MGPLRLLIILLLICQPLSAGQIHIAVASNFKDTLEQLIAEYAPGTPSEFRISSASTGKLYAQIRHGAPYALFLAADSERPTLLVEQGLTLDPQPVTYAIGQLALWAPKASTDADPLELLGDPGLSRLAIANPKTAPYGLAARQTLEKLGLWNRLGSRLVRGENIGHAFQYVASGAAPAGLVALAQLRKHSKAKGLQWTVPGSLHLPIRQQMVRLKAAAGRTEIDRFVSFLASDRARRIILAAGYLAPTDD